MEENKKKKTKKKVPKTDKGKKATNKKTKSENKDAKAKKKDTKMKFKYKHPKIALALKILLLLFLVLCVIGAGVVIGLIYGLWGEDFKIDMSDLILKENSVIVDSEGNVLAELNGDESRKIITLEEMSPYLPKAYVSIEDERYYTHHGVDLKRTSAAILSFITHGGSSTAGGGSTITQQVVKNVTQDKEDSGIKGALRKVKEWVKAYQVETVMSKDQILELYLNLIYVGQNGGKENHGVEIGAEYYFNTTAKDLSIAQCAFLAGINHAPNAYNPYSGKDVTEKIEKRTKTVLSQMKKFEYITQEEYDQAVAEVEAGFQFENGVKGNIYSSHTDALINQVINQIMEEKQISQDAAETYLQTSGLTIYSTQVSSIQSAMEEEAAESKYILESKETVNEDGTPAIAQTGMAVIEPSTGYVVGCVGQIGEKTTSRGLNRATTARQTGSSIKPLADVIPAIEEGLITPATIYADLYTVFAGNYDPENQGDYTTLRTVRSAITTSQNIPFIKIMAELTPAKSMEYLKKMGITTLDDTRDNILALAIGGLTYGISPLEMAAAYAMIANDGVYIEPTFYSKVTDIKGETVLTPKQETRRVCSEANAYIAKDLLTQPVVGAQGTAKYCAIQGIDVAAKTGTTNDNYDRWLCGFTNYYTAATWYGFDENEEIKFNGTNPAGQLWDNVMTDIHASLPNSRFVEPAGITTATICSATGQLATSKCTSTYTEIFVEGTVPEECEGHSTYNICTESGLIANEYCPETERRSYGFTIPKERLKLWTTKSASGGGNPPTGICTIHTKPEETTTTTKQQDTDAPTITLKGNASMTLNVGETYTEPGATAKDKQDGDLTSQIKISGKVDTSKTGTYTVVYTVSDSAGNTTTKKRTVKVVATNTPPEELDPGTDSEPEEPDPGTNPEPED